MRLRDWLDREKKSLRAFAREIGASKSDVSRWASGKGYPRWDALPKIIEATKSEVTANDFVKSPPVVEPVADQ